MLRLALRTNVPVLRPPGLLRSPLFRAFHASARKYLEEDDLIHRVANLETGMHEFKTGIHEFKTGIHEFKTEIKADTKERKAEMKELEKDMNTLKTEVKASDTDRKVFQHDIVQKLDTLRTELTHAITQSQNNIMSLVTQALKDNASATEKQLAAYSLATEKQLAASSLDQQKQFSNLYFRGLFTVLGVAVLLVGSSVIMPWTESRRLDSEIKKRAIIRGGADKLVQGP